MCYRTMTTGARQSKPASPSWDRIVPTVQRFRYPCIKYIIDRYQGKYQMFGEVTVSFQFDLQEFGTKDNDKRRSREFRTMVEKMWIF